MNPTEASDVNRILDWCASVVGPCEVVTGDARFHERSTVWRLRTQPGDHCYLKVHRLRPSWETEVHAYEQWARAFGSRVPSLLAVRGEAPLALLVSELPGRPMEGVRLTEDQERAVWRAAGRALVPLHILAVGECFGPCRRDGSCAGSPISDPGEYVAAEFDRQLDTGTRGGYLDPDEVAIIRAAGSLTPAFAGEQPVPCHRDYGPANWLVTDEGEWAGTIDLEFAYWDVRVADFSRYPDWEWMRRPDLVDAFFEGYGRPLTSREVEQCLVARVRYALSAIVWGHENGFYGFEEEGREALVYLGKVMG